MSFGEIQQQIAASIVQPKFLDQTFNVTDFGGRGDGVTLNTASFAAAIAACAKAGGGRVVIPEGLWLTGPIVFQSNVNLHIEQNALVRFTADYEAYPLRLVQLRGVPRVLVTAPLYAENVENIAITGSGVFDGTGEAWRPIKNWKMTPNQWRTLLASGGVVETQKDTQIWWPNEVAMAGEAKYNELIAKGSLDLSEYEAIRIFMRPRLLHFINCRRVLLDGPTFQNSPFWNVNPLLCEDVTIRNINVRNAWHSQNGDGLDLESCQKVLLEHSTFDVGDDAICIKSGINAEGRKIGVPTAQVVIRDCTVYHGHGGVVIGSEMSGGVNHVYVDRCKFIGTDVGLRFKSTRGRGGVVEQIQIQNIIMTSIAGDAMTFNLHYEVIAPGETVSTQPAPAVPVPTEETPQFHQIAIKNVTVHGAKQALYMRGLPESPFADIHFEDIRISAAAAGLTQIDTAAVTFKNVLFTAGDGAILFKE